MTEVLISKEPYIGYQYKLPHNLQIKAVMDFDQSDDVNDIQRVGFIKNAMVSWKHEGLTLNWRFDKHHTVQDTGRLLGKTLRYEIFPG